MPNLRITVESSAGTLYGPPILTAQSWKSVSRVDKAGTISTLVPAADPRAAVLSEKRVIRCYTQVNRQRTNVATGIIDSLVEGPQIGGASTLQVSGPDLLDELTTRSVQGLDLSSGGAAIPIRTALASIMALAPSTGGGWTIDTTTYGSTGATHTNTTVDNVTNVTNFAIGDGIAGSGIAAGTTITNIVGTTITLSAAATATATGVQLSHPIFLQFAQERVLEALTKVAAQFSEHFRLGSGRSVVYLYKQRPSSGVRLVSRGDPTALESRTDIGILTTAPQRTRDASDLWTRIYPFGGGNNTARTSILTTTRFAAPGTGTATADYAVTLTMPTGSAATFTLHIEANTPTSCYIRNDTAEAIYGRIDAPSQSFKDTSDPGTNTASATAAANAVFDQALSVLKQHSAIQYTYKLSVTGLSVVLVPGTTIDVVYRQTVDGYRATDINTIRDASPLFILETTTQINLDGVRTSDLTVATVDRWPETMATTIQQVVSKQQSMDAHLQRVPQAQAATVPSNTYSAQGTSSVGLATISGTWGTVALDTLVDGSSSVVSGNRLNVIVAGRYAITANVSFPANATGARGIRFRKNGNNALIVGEELRGNAGAGDATVISLKAAEVKLAAGDFIHLQAYQTSGAGMTIDVNSFSPLASLTFLGTN
jgi:hypothetical protein